jgi:hypothetical protein
MQPLRKSSSMHRCGLPHRRAHPPSNTSTTSTRSTAFLPPARGVFERWGLLKTHSVEQPRVLWSVNYPRRVPCLATDQIHFNANALSYCDVPHYLCLRFHYVYLVFSFDTMFHFIIVENYYLLGTVTTTISYNISSVAVGTFYTRK